MSALAAISGTSGPVVVLVVVLIVLGALPIFWPGKKEDRPWWLWLLVVPLWISAALILVSAGR